MEQKERIKGFGGGNGRGQLGITLADVNRWKQEGNAGKLSGLLTSIFPAGDEVVEAAANALCELGEADALARVAKSWSCSDKQRAAGARALGKVRERIMK